ncbi:MAG: hypothetical protein FJX72_07770 [Armatimonadetes bacterium]|nr:hypothetical protein [Armatimonadota bacterium]
MVEALLRSAAAASAFGAAWLLVPGFGTARNLAGMAVDVAPMGIVACAVLFCIKAGDLDLSVEGTLGLAGVMAAIAVGATESALVGVACRTVAAPRSASAMAPSWSGVAFRACRSPWGRSSRRAWLHCWRRAEPRYRSPTRGSIFWDTPSGCGYRRRFGRWDLGSRD